MHVNVYKPTATEAWKSFRNSSCLWHCFSTGKRDQPQVQTLLASIPYHTHPYYLAVHSARERNCSKHQFNLVPQANWIACMTRWSHACDNPLQWGTLAVLLWWLNIWYIPRASDHMPVLPPDRRGSAPKGDDPSAWHTYTVHTDRKLLCRIPWCVYRPTIYYAPYGMHPHREQTHLLAIPHTVYPHRR